MDKKKILVIEDEKAIADILVFNLQREGYDTLVAYDGTEGLRCALEEAPDLILLDVMLPGMDGFEVLGHIREKHDTPIIMLTAREEETDKGLGLEPVSYTHLDGDKRQIHGFFWGGRMRGLSVE